MSINPPKMKMPQGVTLASKQMAPFVEPHGSTPNGTIFTDDLIQRQLQLNAPKKPEEEEEMRFDTPAQRSAAIQRLMPTIRAATNKYAKTTDPVAIGQAKLLVSRALPRYDASKSDIKTFVDRQLRPMIRYSSRRSRKIRLPDRMQIAAASIREINNRYETELGRPPTDRELMKETGLSAKRILAVRGADKSILSGEQTIGEETESTARVSDLPVVDDARVNRAWVNMVREDLPPIDQLILDYTLGLNGRSQLRPNEIATHLKISRSAVSQRMKRIQQILDKEDGLNPFA